MWVPVLSCNPPPSKGELLSFLHRMLLIVSNRHGRGETGVAAARCDPEWQGVPLNLLSIPTLPAASLALALLDIPLRFQMD